MSTPAGWYDDGSGRQRWWDGTQWSEHFAPEEAAAPETSVYPTLPGAPGIPATETAPKKVSVLGLVGLGLAVLGTILVFIPLVGVFGFVLLGIGFVVSLVSLFLKGKKWPGITGLILAIVGTIVGIFITFIYLLTFAEGVQSEVSAYPTTSPSASAPAPEQTESTGETPAGRPTVEEVSAGLTEILAFSGQEDTYTPEQVTCVSEAFVASDIPDDTLSVIASGEEMFTDADAIAAFSEEFTKSGVSCLMQ